MDLIKACVSKDTEKALDLIFELYKVQFKMNNDTNLGIVDNYGCTALHYACRNEMKEVALELIKTGYAKPEQVDMNGNTALTWACQNGMTEVALELIKMGHMNLGQVVQHDNTVLILACRSKMKEVALELIKTGKSNPEQITEDGKTAFIWACENDMKEVAYELVSIGAFTINELLFLKPEWVPEELLIMKPVDVTEVDI